jgi:hypothetical protein
VNEDKFDKGDLKKELKSSGFDDCIALDNNVEPMIHSGRTAQQLQHIKSFMQHLQNPFYF